MSDTTPTFRSADLDAIFARTDNGENSSDFDALIAKSRTELGISNWHDTTGDKDEGLVLNASSPVVANDLAAARAHAADQIKYWTAQKAAVEEVVRDSITALAADRFPDADDAPKKITFKANNVPVATFNLTADSRRVDSKAVMAMFPDVPENAQFWTTVEGSRRLLFK